MAIRLVLIAVFCLCATRVHAQTEPRSVNLPDIDNEYFFGSGRFTRDQRVLSGAHPSLIGLGIQRTIVRRRAVEKTDPFVTVDAFGTGTPWDGRFAGVERLTIDGREPLGKFSYADAEELARSPWGESAGADGIYLDGQGAYVDDVRVHSFRGIGITGRTGGLTVRRSRSHRNYVGVRFPPSDSSIADSFVWACRDACGWLAASAGNVQSSQTHYFGARVAFFNEGGQVFRSANDTMADALVGYLGHATASGSGFATFTGTHFQHNTTRCAIFRSGPVTLTGCTVAVQHRVATSGLPAGLIPKLPAYEGCVGLDVQAPYMQMHGGAIWMTPYHHHTSNGTEKPAEGLWIRSLEWGGWGGDFCTIDCPLVDGDRLDGTIGIRVSGPRKGIRVSCPISVAFGASAAAATDNWRHADDRILVIEHNTLRDCQFEFRGTQPDLLSDPEKYVDLPADWRPAGSGNSITLIRADTGERLELENREY